jgi:hypothetical protein
MAGASGDGRVRHVDSGDIYDVIALADGRILFWLGDVMGHGAQAAFTTAVADAQMKELARTFRRRDEIVLRLDGYLRDNAPRRYGMSLVVAVLDPRTGTVEVSAAGHAPPLHIRGGAASPMGVRPGMVLGMPFVGGRGYERIEVRLDEVTRCCCSVTGCSRCRPTHPARCWAPRGSRRSRRTARPDRSARRRRAGGRPHGPAGQVRGRRPPRNVADQYRRAPPRYAGGSA